MTHTETFQVSGVRACAVALAALCCGTAASAVQAPHAIPPTHERQCVPTGSITPGGTGRVVVRWQRPFATAQYAVIGSVADAEDDVRSVELSHIVMPNSPEVAVAVVVNRDTTAPHSGRVCLDATTESGDVVGALR